MLSALTPLRPLIRQTRGETPLALSDILEDGVNLALWQRQLPLHIAEFGALLVALNEPVADSLVVELGSEEAVPNLQGLAANCRDLEGYEGFIADVSWLVSAFACLLGELLQRCPLSAAQQASGQALWSLQQTCAATDTHRRPLFAEITAQLHALQTAEA